MLASPSTAGQPSPDRRKLFRRLVALAGLGITGVLLSQPQIGFLPPVHAASMTIDAVNNGAGTTNLQSSISNGPAFAATATATSGAVYGILGESNSTAGTGVQGIATASTGATIGVFGQSDSTGGTSCFAIGVDGYATASSGNTYGVYGVSNSTSGVGVDGFATATTGTTYGVYGQAMATTGRGVEGYACATSGFTYGVFGLANSTSGTGVVGHATATTGHAYGVFGESDSVNGTSILAYAGNNCTIPLAAKAFSACQSADLQQWQNSSGAALGVIDPAGRLTVFGASSQISAMPGSGVDARMRMERPSNAQTGAFEFDTGGESYEWLFGNFYSRDYFNIDYWDGSTDHFWFTILQNGNVGIGTTAPDQALSVNGNADKSSGGTSWGTFCDRRWKDPVSIKPFNLGLEWVRTLPTPVRFRYAKDNGINANPEEENVNFIAQDLQDGVHDLLVYETKNKVKKSDEAPVIMYGVNVSAMHFAIVNAIKELAKHNESAVKQLTEQNEVLREEFRLLKSRLDTSEQTIKLTES